MRKLLTRLINRVLLSKLFTPAMGGEAEIHTEGRRRLVVGLGNPGMEGTRHSVGMAVLAALAARLGMADRWRGDKHVSGEVIVVSPVVLLRPQLLMNLNGVSVAKAAGKFGIRPEDIVLVHDELDKPLGKVVIKHGGSARGHNGVRSCVDCLQTDVMSRLRVGIGRPAGKTPVERYVLGRFSSEEKKVLDSVLAQSVDLLLSQLALQDSQPPPHQQGAGERRRRGGRRRRALRLHLQLLLLLRAEAQEHERPQRRSLRRRRFCRSTRRILQPEPRFDLKEPAPTSSSSTAAPTSVFLPSGFV